jgi:ribosomal protein S12 methylthiotransferase accessory factor
MTVVRAIIPGLQPLTFHHRARFLGHPRLYEAPVRMGYPARLEAELNAWPQPFA